MSRNLTKIGLIALAALASIGVVVASFNTAKNMGLFTRAEVAYGPTESPQVVATDTTSTVSWRSKSPVISVVNYGTTETDLSIPIFEASQTSEHNVKITGLLPDQIYYYEIVSSGQTFRDSDASGKSVPYSFRTLPASSPQLTYPPCDIQEFKTRYGSSRGEANYQASYDINDDGTITTVDFFECIKVNPPK